MIELEAMSLGAALTARRDPRAATAVANPDGAADVGGRARVERLLAHVAGDRITFDLAWGGAPRPETGSGDYRIVLDDGTELASSRSHREAVRRLIRG